MLHSVPLTQQQATADSHLCGDSWILQILQNFWGSVIREQLGWVTWLRVPHGAAVRCTLELQPSEGFSGASLSKVILKILQARLQQYMNWELTEVQAGFSKGRGTSDQIANICWIKEKSREYQENIYFCFLDYAKAFDFVDYKILFTIL